MTGVVAAIGTIGGMTAVAAPSAATGFYPNDTNLVSVTVSGGVAPYSYLWQASGASSVSPTNPTSSQTRFTGGPDAGSLYTCRVTDAVGQVVNSNAVLVVISSDES